MQLGAGLSLATPDTRRWQQVVANGSSTGVAVRLDDSDLRVRLGLAFLGGRKVVDVSPDPASWIRCLRRGARVVDQPHTRWADALSSGLRRTGTERGWWHELPQNLEPDLTAAAAAWPLARPAIEAGFDERCVPRWAIPLLSAADVATGTRALLGDRADRRVVREMASALTGPVRWWPIACAVALVQLDSGRIGDMLAESAETYRCSQDERLLLARTLGSARPNVVRRLLASADGPDGPARLLAALDGWQRIGADRCQLPNRLDRLEAAVHAELEVPPPRRPRPEPVVAPARPRRVQPRRHVREDAPPQARPDRPQGPQPPEPLHIPAQWQGLHRARRGRIDLVIPSQREELARWGTALNNCLGAYPYLITEGLTVVVGIRCDERLVGAVEIHPTRGSILQLEGRANRPLPDEIRADVLALLAEHGVSE